ncbi:hypothetical protein EC968_003131 [Mortierella alpina]|nr:hypothetical protein EC968_003131 [Mortierella alpina]
MDKLSGLGPHSGRNGCLLDTASTALSLWWHHTLAPWSSSHAVQLHCIKAERTLEQLYFQPVDKTNCYIMVDITPDPTYHDPFLRPKRAVGNILEDGILEQARAARYRGPAVGLNYFDYCTGKRSHHNLCSGSLTCPHPDLFAEASSSYWSPAQASQRGSGSGRCFSVIGISHGAWSGTAVPNIACHKPWADNDMLVDAESQSVPMRCLLPELGSDLSCTDQQQQRGGGCDLGLGVQTRGVQPGCGSVEEAGCSPIHWHAMQALSPWRRHAPSRFICFCCLHHSPFFEKEEEEEEEEEEGEEEEEEKKGVNGSVPMASGAPQEMRCETEAWSVEYSVRQEAPWCRSCASEPQPRPSRRRRLVRIDVKQFCASLDFELPPLKRGTYDLDAILAAAENAEFAVPPPPSKSSFNSNPFASSTPSAFRSSFNTSSAPSISNSPYPSSPADGDQDASSPVPEKPHPPRKPVVSPAPRKRVSTLKSTLSKFSAPRKPDLEPVFAENATDDLENNLHTASTDLGPTPMQDANEVGNRSYSTNGALLANQSGSVGDYEDLSFEDKRPGLRSPGSIGSPTPSYGNGGSRPLRTVPFNRMASPGPSSSHLDPTARSPSRTGSPVNASSGSIGIGNDLAVYSTPSSSRPTSRPTSRPASRVSSNGRYHSRQLSSDSLLSFNAMVDKDDPDDQPLNHSGHVSFVVSDPEHLRILEGEIEDPFSPSMSSLDPDTDAYLNSLMQQSSPFASLKTSSRGQSPAFKSRRQRAAEGDESFIDSTDDALSDKEVGSKFRSSRAGTRTPSSPLARAVTKGFSRDPENMVVSAMARASGQLSLDQILQDNQDAESGIETRSQGSLTSPGSSSKQGSDLKLSPAESCNPSAASEPIKLVLHSPSSQPVSPTTTFGANGRQVQSTEGSAREHQHNFDSEKRDPTDIEHVEVDIVVQNVRVNDNDESGLKINDLDAMDILDTDYSDLDDVDDLHFNQSGTDVLANEEMHLHESVDIPETHAQSFADWMSSSAEISRLDISPPLTTGQQPPTPFGSALTPAPVSMPAQGTSLLSVATGPANVLTSSYTPSMSSPEAAFASPVSTSPTASKRTTLLEKRSHLMEDLMAKARDRSKHKTEASQLLTAAVEKEKAMVALSSSGSSSVEVTESGSGIPSVSFAGVDQIKIVEQQDQEGPQVAEEGTLSPADSSGSEKKEGGLVRRPSGIMLSSRIRDSTNLDAPRYSIREMEDMKKNVRMDLRIEITNEIREEYERSAEQEAALFQFEIEELRTALEKEKAEKSQLKGVLDEFESSLADIAVSTAKEIQTIKEQNKKLSESKEETEEAFVLLKTRYDELKNLNSKHVENEGILRRAVETLKQDFETSESRFENVKVHADAKLAQASQEMEQARAMYDNEIAQLKAQLNRQEMQMRTLEQALEIKNRENEDLILFSEELIAKLS